MNIQNIEKKEKNMATFEVKVPADVFDNAVNEVYKKNKNHLYVAGFRKGKAPRAVIEGMYGKEVFYPDAIEALAQDAFEAGRADCGFECVGAPSLIDQKVTEDKELIYTFEVGMYPEVELGQYKGLEVEKDEADVTDTQVQAELERMAQNVASTETVERAAEMGDTANIDFEGFDNGVPFDGGKGENFDLKLGSGQFVPGFEEQVVGMTAGEEKDIDITFPENYHENLAGKPVVFHVKLNKVTVTNVPELDDEFAKDVSEFDTLAELIADKRKKMEEQAAKNEKIAIENIALKTVCDNAEVEVPECMTERQANYMLRDMGYRLQMSGISLEDYCRYVGTDLNALKASYHDEAASRVKMQLVIEAVGKAENVTCTDEEIAEVIKEYAENNDMPVEEFEKQISDDDREFLSDRKIAEKTVALIVDNVKLVPAKKTEEK